MRTEKHKQEFHLVHISKNRYKVVQYEEEFTMEQARKIPGCYFSGAQQAWVFPISEKNRRIFKELVNQPTGPLKSNHTLTTEVIANIEEFKKYLEIQRYSESTIRTYTSLLTRFFTFYKDKYPLEIQIKDIEEYNHYHIKLHKRSASFQNQVISALKKFYEKCYNRNLIFENLERPIKSKPLPKVLSQVDIKKLLSNVYNLKHKAILSLIYSAGLRRSEVLNLLITDVDSNRMVLNIRNAKGKKDRIVALSGKILDLLRRYYRNYKPREYLFEGQNGGKYSAESVGKIFQRAKLRSGIVITGGVHILRHSFATHLHESGYDIRIIQEILGHRSSKTTEIYTHVSTKSIRNVKSPFEDLADFD